jgi:hypothetical protein
MACLKSLRILLLVLTGFADSEMIEESSVLIGALPDSIEHLWIDLSESLVAGIEPYFTCLQRVCEEGKFPNLKSIYLQSDNFFGIMYTAILGTFHMLMKLRNLFQAGSISFDIQVTGSWSGRQELFPHNMDRGK